MENPLHEANEHIEHLEHSPASRLKVVVTVTILVVTMLTTLAGVMAATWSARESESQRARQQAAAETLKINLEATARQGAVDQGIDDVTEAQWRSSFLNTFADEESSPAVASVLRAQARAATRAADDTQAGQPPGADFAHYASYAAKLRQPALVQEQVAKAHAYESEGWLAKNNSALAVVSMLALSLFLLGLTLTIGNRATQIGFTALAIAMTVIAGARLVQVATQPIVIASDACIESYAEGLSAESSGETAKADSELADVVRECPEFEAAWQELGSVRFGQGTATMRTAAEDAYRHALDVADVKTGELYNAVGYMQILNRHLASAQENLEQAGRLDPENPVIMMSRAELAAAHDNQKGVQKYFGQAFQVLRPRGPYFRTAFFGSLREDRNAFAEAGIHNAAVDDFFLSCRNIEALLDDPTTAFPLQSHGASISNLVFRKSHTLLGKNAGFITIGFDYSGLKAGDSLSFRFYADDDTTLDLTASLNKKLGPDDSLIGAGSVPPDSTFKLGLAYSGRTTLEVYLNGVEQGSVSYPN